MTSSRNRHTLAVALALLGVTYPFLVCAGAGRVPPAAWVGLARSLALGRLAMLRRQALARHLLPLLILVVVALSLLGVMDAALAARLYPILMGLAFAAAFGLSLLRPPSLIEVFAALTDPADPEPAARAYMRAVAWVWFGFLLCNAAVATATLWAEPFTMA